MTVLKKYIFCFLILTSFGLISCKKFLDVKTITALSGNNFFKTKDDYESFTNNIYQQLWNKFSNAPFFAAGGELRSGEIRPPINEPKNDGSARDAYNFFALNDLRTVLSSGRSWSNNFNYSSLTKWQEFYQVIQSCNILVNKSNADAGSNLSAGELALYKAEATFIRCFTYFYMVRLYGNVPYYTNSNQSQPLGRENFVSVLNKCIEDLTAVKNDLPFRYEDSSMNGFRASRGAVIDLLMNMYMWNAGFDAANKTLYYEKTVALGKEIVESNAYNLVTIENFNPVMLGGTEEGLFSLKQGVDFGNPNKIGFIGEILVASPDKDLINGTYSYAFYRSQYLQRIYDDPTDKRISLWFTSPYSNNGNFSMKKFTGPLGPNGFPDWALVVSRYADAILLRAEAAAELGRDEDAIAMLDIIRRRAGAMPFDVDDENLKDAIFKERCRELIGEGYLYYDLVRTKRILDGSWTSNPLTASQFNDNAWTWPIDASALNRNPFMTLNEYWL